METDPTAAAAPEPDLAPVASTAVMSTEPAAPPEPPPTGFEQVKEMVGNGVKAVEAGFQAGTKEFHKQFHPLHEDGAAGVLDLHGFRAWRAAHSEGCDSAELDAVEARAVVDPDVETAEAKAAREAIERAEETPEAKEVREQWEAETGRTTHFAVTADGSPQAAQGAGVQAVDPTPASSTGTPSNDGATPPVQLSAPEPTSTTGAEPIAVDLVTGKPV